MFRKVVKSQAPTESRTEFRLDVLERQIASLTSGGRLLRYRVRSPLELITRLERASSHSEALEIAKAALVGGMPWRLVVDIVRKGMRSPREANAVLSGLGNFQKSVG